MKHLQEYVDWVKLTKKYNGNDAVYLGPDTTKERHKGDKGFHKWECVSLQVTYPGEDTRNIIVEREHFAAQVTKDILLLGGADKELLEDYGEFKYSEGRDDEAENHADGD